MNGYQITFFTQQNRTHKHQPMHQWLIELADSLQIHGVTVVAAQEGVGGDHRVHSARFFELADQPLEITMLVSDEEGNQLMDRLKSEPDLHLFYSKMPVEFGSIGTPK